MGLPARKIEPLTDKDLDDFIDATYTAEAAFFQDGGALPSDSATYNLVIYLNSIIRQLVSHIRSQQK